MIDNGCVCMCAYETNKPYSQDMLESLGVMCLIDVPHCATFCISLCIHKGLSAGAVIHVFLGSVEMIFMEVSRLLTELILLAVRFVVL